MRFFDWLCGEPQETEEDREVREFAEGLARALAETFADNPDVEVYMPIPLSQLVGEEEEEERPWWKIW